jgi:hypothetical protein
LVEEISRKEKIVGNHVIHVHYAKDVIMIGAWMLAKNVTNAQLQIHLKMLMDIHLAYFHIQEIGDMTFMGHFIRQITELELHKTLRIILLHIKLHFIQEYAIQSVVINCVKNGERK